MNMKSRYAINRNVMVSAVLAAIGIIILGTGCTEEEAAAVLAGVQVVADELDEGDEVSFRDWLSSELDD